MDPLGYSVLTYGMLNVSALPTRIRVAMTGMHFQQTTADGTGEFDAATNRRKAKP